MYNEIMKNSGYATSDYAIAAMLRLYGAKIGPKWLAEKKNIAGAILQGEKDGKPFKVFEPNPNRVTERIKMGFECIGFQMPTNKPLVVFEMRPDPNSEKAQTVEQLGDLVNKWFKGQIKIEDGRRFSELCSDFAVMSKQFVFKKGGK